MNRNVINIYGGGATAIFFLSKLENYSDYHINLYTNKSTIGSKFLVAGKGGFNLTNACLAENLPSFYVPSHFLKSALIKYNNQDFIEHLKHIGIPTFIGSSKRVFPLQGIKPIEVLNAFKKSFTENVQIFYNYNFIGFTPKGIKIQHQEKELELEADYHIFALGGASWSVTGSKGDWLQYFTKEKIKTQPFSSCNSGIELDHQFQEFCDLYQGKSIKNIDIHFQNQKIKGEFNITSYGLEGNAIYPLSLYITRHFRENSDDKKDFFIDFKPQWSKEKIENKILNSSSPNITKALKSLNLSKESIQFIKAGTSKSDWKLDNIANLVKAFKVKFSKLRNIEESISSSGGIDINELNQRFELIKKPTYYCLGEMVDWDTRTGGFLLQACYSMASTLANHLNSKIKT